MSRNWVIESEPSDPEEDDLWIPVDVGGTCDWGDCDGEATCRRYTVQHGWLPVCDDHALSEAAGRKGTTAQ